MASGEMPDPVLPPHPRPLPHIPRLTALEGGKKPGRVVFAL
jgi:hypothetical protein